MDLLIYFSVVFILFFISWNIPKRYRIVAAYSSFFLTPVLTFFGVLAPLTGFDGQENNFFYGLSFISVLIAYLILNKEKYLDYSAIKLLLIVFNPIYMLSGPFPVGERKKVLVKYKKIILKIYFVHRYFIIGAFFLFAISPGLIDLLELRKSTNLLDIIVFCIVFEGYVYFNFAGFTFISWSIMTVLGISVPKNFNEPFSSHSVIEYWKRWHISLSIILKSLFFVPIRKRYGVFVAVTFVFIASAMWHGMTINFIIWGVFHSIAWNLSRWMHLRNMKKALQIFLLIFVVLFGRLLFSESNLTLLFEKIHSIIYVATESASILPVVINNLGKVDLLRILMGIIWIGIEIYNGLFFKKTDYNILKKPLVSIFILTVTLLLFYQNIPDAIYGAR